jgi:hypothetical protein
VHRLQAARSPSLPPSLPPNKCITYYDDDPSKNLAAKLNRARSASRVGSPVLSPAVGAPMTSQAEATKDPTSSSSCTWILSLSVTTAVVLVAVPAEVRTGGMQGGGWIHGTAC